MRWPARAGASQGRGGERVWGGGGGGQAARRSESQSVGQTRVRRRGRAASPGSQPRPTATVGAEAGAEGQSVKSKGDATQLQGERSRSNAVSFLFFGGVVGGPGWRPPAGAGLWSPGSGWRSKRCIESRDVIFFVGGGVGVGGLGLGAIQVEVTQGKKRGRVKHKLYDIEYKAVKQGRPRREGLNGSSVTRGAWHRLHKHVRRAWANAEHVPGTI